MLEIARRNVAGFFSNNDSHFIRYESILYANNVEDFTSEWVGYLFDLSGDDTSSVTTVVL